MLRNLMLCAGLVGIILLLSQLSQSADAGWSQLALTGPGRQIVEVKKNGNDNKQNRACTKLLVCDYFAPTTWCSAAPCCKKWHYEVLPVAANAPIQL